MDLNLVKLLFVLFPGVIAFVLSERMIERMGRGRQQVYKATIGIMCFSGWIYGLYAIIRYFDTTICWYEMPTYDFISLVFSTASYSVNELLNYALDFLIILGIAIFLGLVYSWGKNIYFDDKLLWLLGIRHSDRTEVWYQFNKGVRGSPRTNKNHWVRVDFEDCYATGWIKWFSVSQDVDTMIVLADVQLYKKVDYSQDEIKEVLRRRNLGEECILQEGLFMQAYPEYLLDFAKSGVTSIAVFPLKERDSWLKKTLRRLSRAQIPTAMYLSNEV